MISLGTARTQKSASLLYVLYDSPFVCASISSLNTALRARCLLQNRMQRCAMDCADEAKDTIPAGAKEGDAVVERAMAQVRRGASRPSTAAVVAVAACA